jgi:hypothetical protein
MKLVRLTGFNFALEYGIRKVQENQVAFADDVIL